LRFVTARKGRDWKRPLLRRAAFFIGARRRTLGASGVARETAMVRVRFLLIVLLGLLAGPGAAQAPLDMPAAERAAIRGVIETQLDAFRRDDGAAAFGLATPNIQAMFGTPENFLAMVRHGYAAVYRPRTVEFAEIVGDAEHPVQLVRVVGPDGETVIAAYEMARQHSGWRINGCVLLRPPGRST
jgi:hypothetical protein